MPDHPLLIALFSLPLCLHAAEPAPPVPPPSRPLADKDLPPVVVTATRGGGTPLQAPHPVRTLAGAELQERQVRSLPEALRETPGVMLQKTANAQGSPYIRGFTGFRNLALIDGIRFNNSTFRDGPNQYWNTIDAYAVDRIELVPGQGGVLYGSDSVGGTLNLFTKGANFRDEAPGFFFHGLSSYRGATAEESNVGRQELQFGEGGRWGLHLGASLKSFGDVHAAGLGDQPHTGYDEWAYDGRLDIALDAHWTLTAVHQQLRQNDAWRTHQTTSGVSWQGTTIGGDLKRAYDQERTLSYLRLSGADLDGFIDAAHFTVSLQSANEYEHRIRTTRTDHSQVELTTLGFDLQLESDTRLGRFTYGVDYYRDRVSSGSQRYRTDGSLHSIGIQGPVGDDATYDLLGFYLQDQFDLGQRVHVFLGARYTHAAADIGRFDDPSTARRSDRYSDRWSDFSASGRVVADLDTQDRFKAYAGVAQGFRAPNLSDLSRLDTALSGEQELPSTGLEPEEFVTFEAGLKAETGRFSGSFGYFYTLIDNLIVRRPVGDNEAVKANVGNGFMQGVELAGSVRLDDQWSIFGHLTWTEGRVDQYPTTAPEVRREGMSRVVPLIGRAGIRWQSRDRRLWSELVCLAQSRYDSLTSSEKRDTQRMPPNGNPGFANLILRGGWQATRNLNLTLALENLLDQEFRYTGSGSNEPGFGAVVGATLTF